MGITRSVLTVFVASPGDVAEERHALAAVASRVNRITGRDWGWEIDLRGWEDTLPGYARPQALINPDVDDCDVFVGVLWKRWGQPTGTHSSGFEEELERAIRRHETTGRPEIMLYFREIEDDAERDAGPQLQRVIDFRASVLSSRSMLYRVYHDLAEFDVLVFEHLMRVLGQHAAPTGTVSNGQAAAALLHEAQEAFEPVTLLDLASDPLMTPERLRDRWSQAADETDIPLLPCALGQRGLYRFNLFDRNHSATLLVGTTRSGKTEALLSITASLALSIPPDMLRITFFDLKSNSYVRALEDLGVAAGSPVVDPGSAFEVLMDDLQRREQVLISQGARDVQELWHLRPNFRREVPFWLVCVDEISGLMQSHEDGLEKLATVTRHARSLGVHVIFGSQVIAGIGAGIRGLCTRRICLRMLDHMDSLDVVGVPEAAMMPSHAPGMALVREGSEEPRLVRFAWMSHDAQRVRTILGEARSDVLS